MQNIIVRLDKVNNLEAEIDLEQAFIDLGIEDKKEKITKRMRFVEAMIQGEIWQNLDTAYFLKAYEPQIRKASARKVIKKSCKMYKDNHGFCWNCGIRYEAHRNLPELDRPAAGIAR